MDQPSNGLTDGQTLHGNRRTHLKRWTRANNSLQYPLPCCTHLGNLKGVQQGKGQGKGTGRGPSFFYTLFKAGQQTEKR